MASMVVSSVAAFGSLQNRPHPGLQVLVRGTCLDAALARSTRLNHKQPAGDPVGLKRLVEVCALGHHQRIPPEVRLLLCGFIGRIHREVELAGGF